MLKLFYDLNTALSEVVWGPPMLVLIVGTGLYLSLRTGFVQIFGFGSAMKNTFGRLLTAGRRTKSGAITPFQALTTALAGTVGTGNIAGVTSAVTLGGPGSIFWLWVSALIGMCTKYAEVVLAVRFREKNRAGEWVGGPMYYIKNGLGEKYRWLASAFCVFGAVAALGVGNAVQVATAARCISSTAALFAPSAEAHQGAIGLAVGSSVAAITAFSLLGGIRRIGRVTEVIVPAMAAVYLLACLAVILAHIGGLLPALAQIFRCAFTPQAAAGGAAGISVRAAVSWGFRRGVFSNEAGLGSAPIAHASTSENSPVLQGFYGIMEVFIDTLVICTITGLTLLVSGVDMPYGRHASVELNISAFSTVFGWRASGVIISTGMVFFALATVLGWAVYGTRCAEFLFGQKISRVYQALYALSALLGATVRLDAVWQLADTLNGLMAVPNLIALLTLSGTVAGLTRAHFERRSGPCPASGGLKLRSAPAVGGGKPRRTAAPRA